MTASSFMPTSTHWLPLPGNDDDDNVDDDSLSLSQTTTSTTTSSSCLLALCLGTGRFLRSVLVPALVGAGIETVVIQPRGRSFLEYMKNRTETNNNDNTFEVDTVQPDGSIVTENIACGGAFSLGNAQDKLAALTWISNQTKWYVNVWVNQPSFYTLMSC
jgi:hypothetical protein